MIDLLFGWITKPMYLQTIIDEIFKTVEVSIVVFIIILIYIKVSERRRK